MYSSQIQRQNGEYVDDKFCGKRLLCRRSALNWRTLYNADNSSSAPKSTAAVAWQACAARRPTRMTLLLLCSLKMSVPLLLNYYGMPVRRLILYYIFILHSWANFLVRCMCFLPIYSVHQAFWTYHPGSHRRKVTQDFSSTFLLRCLRLNFSREKDSAVPFPRRP